MEGKATRAARGDERTHPLLPEMLGPPDGEPGRPDVPREALPDRTVTRRSFLQLLSLSECTAPGGSGSSLAALFRNRCGYTRPIGQLPKFVQLLYAHE